MTERALTRKPADVVDVQGPLAAKAEEIAAAAPSPGTRKSYAGTYRRFLGWLGPSADVDQFTRRTLTAYRDYLEADGAAPATIARHLSALRHLAVELELPADVLRVRSERVDRPMPRPLTPTEYENLLDKASGKGKRRRRGPGARARQARDLAAIRLMGDAGLRRSEVIRLRFDHFEEGGRLSERGLRGAISHVSRWVVRVEHSKRGRNRQVPLTKEAADALLAWVRLRPDAPCEELFVSIPRRVGEAPAPLRASQLHKMVKRYAEAADVREDRCTPHALRHTFCTELAARGVEVLQIAKLAGHQDVRTTQVYVDVSDAGGFAAIGKLAQGRTQLARAA